MGLLREERYRHVGVGVVVGVFGPQVAGAAAGIAGDLVTHQGVAVQVVTGVPHGVQVALGAAHGQHVSPPVLIPRTGRVLGQRGVPQAGVVLQDRPLQPPRVQAVVAVDERVPDVVDVVAQETTQRGVAVERQVHLVTQKTLPLPAQVPLQLGKDRGPLLIGVGLGTQPVVVVGRPCREMRIGVFGNHSMFRF